MIAARNIHKRYGRTRVLCGVDLAADAGQIVAIVGENGCGKSTLLRVLAGAEAMEVGEIVRPASLGYCPQDSVLYPYLTPDEHFDLFGCGILAGGELWQFRSQAASPFRLRIAVDRLRGVVTPGVVRAAAPPSLAVTRR